MNPSLTQCPICSGNLKIGKYRCMSCLSEISGEFAMPEQPLNLDQELIDFIKIFIYTEGSIKQSEKLMNCSYPKIKNLLKKTKAALGISEQDEKAEESVIDRLEKGEISVEEALKQLQTD